MTISHRIELIPNNKAKTYFNKAFGCARLAYNWGLARWKELYEQGEKPDWLSLKKEFNSIKREKFPFVMEVSKYAAQQPFNNLNLAFQKFFRDLKKGKTSYPKFKKKKTGSGSFYIGGDQVVLTGSPKISKKLKIENPKKKYLKIPNLGYVKMTEELRFDGKINSVTISRKADRFFASFSVEITEEEFLRTHKPSVNNENGIGIDVGLKSFAVTSSGLEIHAPKPLSKNARRLIEESRRLSRKVHPKTKGDRTEKSANYQKETIRLAKIHYRIACAREDFLHKLSTALVRHHGYLAAENLTVSNMMKNHRLARSVSDAGWFEFRRMFEYKAKNWKKTVVFANRFFASTRLCHKCGHKQDMPLNVRTYVCSGCGAVTDRDLNAALNLYSEIEKQIGRVPPESTPADLAALSDCLLANGLASSKVETGIQQKCS